MKDYGWLIYLTGQYNYIGDFHGKEQKESVSEEARSVDYQSGCSIGQGFQREYRCEFISDI